MTRRELAQEIVNGSDRAMAWANRILAAPKRKPRVPRSKRPAAVAKATKRKTKAQIKAANRAAVAERAGGRCEYRTPNFAAARCECAGVLQRDHFWGSARDESVSGSWMLCVRHHQWKTDWVGGRAEWLISFRNHVECAGYEQEFKKCQEALALETAQHPERP